MAEIVYSRGERETYVVSVRAETRYSIVIENGGIGRLADHIRAVTTESQCISIFVVTDQHSLSHHGEAVLEQLNLLDLPVSVHVLEPGERSKTLDSVVRLWESMNKEGVKRRSLVLAVGGGVVSDVAGFASQNYLRGLPLILVPTTLLAQIDAAIGGKNGVTYLEKKNRIGSFYHPKMVLVDPELLRTLPRTQIAEGYAEAVKIAYLDSSSMVDALFRASSDRRSATDALPAIIARSIERKLQLLSSDPYETEGLDRALNLGHCFGHPVEEVLRHRIGHGSAVAIGMSLAASLGVVRGVSSAQMRDELVELLRAFGLPQDFPVGLDDQVWEALENVREVRNGRLRPVIPVRPGVWAFGDDVAKSEWMKICQDTRL